MIRCSHHLDPKGGEPVFCGSLVKWYEHTSDGNLYRFHPIVACDDPTTVQESSDSKTPSTASGSIFIMMIGKAPLYSSKVYLCIPEEECLWYKPRPLYSSFGLTRKTWDWVTRTVGIFSTITVQQSAESVISAWIYGMNRPRLKNCIAWQAEVVALSLSRLNLEPEPWHLYRPWSVNFNYEYEVFEEPERREYYEYEVFRRQKLNVTFYDVDGEPLRPVPIVDVMLIERHGPLARSIEIGSVLLTKWVAAKPEWQTILLE